MDDPRLIINNSTINPQFMGKTQDAQLTVKIRKVLLKVPKLLPPMP